MKKDDEDFEAEDGIEEIYSVLIEDESIVIVTKWMLMRVQYVGHVKEE